MCVTVKTVTVLGGYGIFGARISAGLAETPGLNVRVAARNRERGQAHAERIGGEFRLCRLDDGASLARCIEGSDLLVHTAGPFQGHDYRVARTC